MKFKEEFSKNLIYGFFAIAVVLILMGGYYFHSIEKEMDYACSNCVTDVCMDNDILCGDFGIYWFKTFALISMSMFGVMILLCSKTKEEETHNA